MGWVQVFFKTRIGFRAGSGLVKFDPSCPAPPRPKYEITTLPPTYKYLFSLSFQVFFFSHFRVFVLSTLGLFLPLNTEIYLKIHSIISFPPSPLDSSLFISYSQLLAVSSVYATVIFSIGIISSRSYKPVWFFVDLYLFVLFFVSWTFGIFFKC